MAKWWVAAVLVLAVAGCTRPIDDPQARPAPQVGPISPLQVGDLLSPEIFNKDGNLFATVEPERCAGVAREVDPPFIVDHEPEARDGGHWSTDVGGIEAVVEEMVAVMPSDFSAQDALTAARGTIDACRDTPITVTTMYGRTYTFRLAAAEQAAPEGAVLWSLRAADWNCDNLFVAAHNAAIETTSCGAAGGIDVATAAEDALKRIEALVDNKA
ncbi:sensor domain-containing protein [Mycobacterium sp. Root265]|uniref:sensor domain-containing protein n=1 Tax=Mycobacterium sp. Root265 TaxID=1736504 RepID=UPI000AC6FBC0|nr:sensor domain-containing protein [Mycobacterium sp. Root265]